MNKINNFDDLFKKYEVVLNKNKNINYKYSKEIQFKINNIVECNCELCKNEIACQNKMIEINKNLITNIKTDNIFYKGKNNEINENVNKKNNLIFSKSKTLHSFEIAHHFTPKINKDEINKSGLKKRDKSENKSSDKKQKRESMKKKEKEEYIDLTQNNKIEYYFEKEVKNEKDKTSSQKKKDKKNIKKKNIKNKDNISGNETESEEEKETKNKKNRKSKGKDIIEIISDTESDNGNGDRSSSKKKKIRYPKINRKNKRKK